VSRPDGSAASIVEPTAAATTFTPDVVGTYFLRLTVNDGTQDSPPVVFGVNVDSNLPPAADLTGSDTSGVVGEVITLDGRQSSDPEGQVLTFDWQIVEQPEGSDFNLIVLPGRALMTVDTPGDYRVQLIVNDGVLDSDPAQLVINVADPTALVSDDEVLDRTSSMFTGDDSNPVEEDEQQRKSALDQFFTELGQ
jgi:hypothetical protein